MNFKRLVKRNPSESLKDIALLNDIDEDVVAAYLENSEASPLTECEKESIKEQLDNGFSLTEIAGNLKLSQKMINEYVECKFILFNGRDGDMVLKIINKRFGKYSVNKLRELITKRDVKLQEIICFELPKSDQREYANVKDYFEKFEESRKFYEIEKTLNIEARTCIRASSLDDVRELSLKLNRVEKVIRDYLLQFNPDNILMSLHEHEHFKKIIILKRNLGIDSHISHTEYRMIISDSFDTLIEKAKKLVGNPQMKILKEILPLAFYYIKCSLSLEELTQIIASMTNVQLTTLDIFHLIFQMSDPVVRGLCIEHYSFSNPVPFYYPILGPYPPEQTACKFEICKELWYSLQQFSGLVSFGLGWASWNPVGKSYLLDLMFETDFVKGSPQNSPFHLGSIDIQMTKNLFGDRNKHETTKWTYIDCNRISDINLIRDICKNLDIALIHVSYSDYTENYLCLEAELNTITVNNKHVYVLVRDFSGNDQNRERIIVDGKFTFILIPNLIKPDKKILLELRKYGYMILHPTTTNPKLVGSNFLEILITRYGSWENLKREKELIESVKNDIYTSTNTEGKIDFSFLSYYPHFVEYMSSYYEASSQTDQKISDELNEKCEHFAKHLENAEMSAIVWHFNEILSEENSTLILWKLSQELNMLSKQKISSNDGTSYTLEILWREALLSSKYDLISKSNPMRNYFETLSSNFSFHVERGEPFELIDGDNLRFFNQDINVLLSKFYERQFLKETIFNKNERPPIVVSIFGPQSSGKSTLLNYCFGCKFLTSAGRCTKGVYGSLSKLSRSINNSDHFLILDTEGLDAIEKGKKIQDTSCINFDRTMVLFCLAVSQVAIINVKGDLGEEMRNILQICAYSLNKLKVSKVAAPKIFFVLNQQADPDPNKHLSSINTLLEKLNEESYLMETEGLKISDLIQVSKENLFVLPSAFNSQSLNTQITKLFDSDLCKLTPTISFANKSTNLRMSIISQLKNDTIHIKDFSNMKDDYRIPFNTMSEWLEMSGVIWDTIVKYQDIVKYSNTDELKCSKTLSKILNEIMKHIIYSNKEKYRDITETLIIKIKDIKRWSPPKVMLEDVKTELHETFEKYQEEALTIFLEKCKSDPLLKKMDYMCDDSKSNLNRLIYMEKKIYEDKLKFEIKARLTEIKLTEKMTKFQQVIEKNADRYLDLTIEEQTREFEVVWISCFSRDIKEGEEDVLAEKFDDLYSVFRMESKTMENKQTIYTLFRDSKFDMATVVNDLGKTMLSRFCDERNHFTETQFIYPWKENRVPIKEMTPYPDNVEFEYLSKDSLYKMVDQSKLVFQAAKTDLDFSTWVPTECYPLVKYCSGYYNHPDIIWKQEKRKQILLLASQLKDPNDFRRSTWDKFLDDLAKNIQEFTKRDPNISYSTVKEIVNFLCRICKVVNYEINFIEAKLTNAAERTISTYAFAFAFRSILKTKFENHRETKSNENERKINDLKYFLQKVENRKLARGNWDRKKMREGVQSIANKFAGDFLEAVWRGVSTECEQSINERYFDAQKDRLSYKSILLLANKKITEEFHNNEPTDENNTILESIRHLFYVENVPPKELCLNEPVDDGNDDDDSIIQSIRDLIDFKNVRPKELLYPNEKTGEDHSIIEAIRNLFHLKNVSPKEFLYLDEPVDDGDDSILESIRHLFYIENLPPEELHYLNEPVDEDDSIIQAIQHRIDVENLRTEEPLFLNKGINEDNFVVQFTCNRTETLKIIFQEEWRKVVDELHLRIIGDMKGRFIKQLKTIRSVLTEFSEGLVAMCTKQECPEGIGLDADSNFEVTDEPSTGDSACGADPKTRVIPFKAMVLFLEMYLNPNVKSEQFVKFFSDLFEVDGVKMQTHHDTYVLFEKPQNPTQVLDEDLFKKLSDTNMFSSTEIIFNIKAYVQGFLRTLDCYEYQVTEDEYEYILKATKEKFEACVINCPSKCPSCGKFCEKEIHSQEGKCQILTGHQICSMGGNVWNNNEEKTAILLMCEDYKEDSPVLILGQNMKWSDFKEKCGDQWDWNFPTDERYVTLQKENRERMKTMWNKFGREILNYYASRGTEITYIPYTSPEKIHKSLFLNNYYICFVIAGTELMRNAFKYARKWVSEVMKNSKIEGPSKFKVIVYHGHHHSESIKKFPDNSGFTSDARRIKYFLKNSKTFGREKNEATMLHGLATAAKESDWTLGFGIINLLVHFYVEPTRAHFNAFTSKGSCDYGCHFNWETDIKDRMNKMNIEFKYHRLINSSHPRYKYGKPINDQTSSGVNLKARVDSELAPQIFIQYKKDN